MKKIVLSIAVAAAFVACEQKSALQPVEPETPADSQYGVSEVALTAGFDYTKTLLDGNSVVWEDNDEIAVKFSAQSVVNVVNFATEEGGETATFKAIISDEVSTTNGYADDLFAVYPASVMDASGNVSSSLPSVTTVAPGSFPSGSNLSSAKASLNELRAGTATANFMNAYSIIRFTLPENVKSLDITGTAVLAGDAKMVFDGNGRLNANAYTTESKTLTLVDAQGGLLKAGQVYNLLCYPNKHTSLTVKLVDSDNCTYSKTVESTFLFEPAKYYTFNFNQSFTKEFSFTVTGATLDYGTKIMAVFEDGATKFAREANLNGNDFTVQLPHGVNATSGYVVYPSSCYSEGKINYDINVIGEPRADFYWGVISSQGGNIALTGVRAYDFACVRFTLPSGVVRYELNSNQTMMGPAELTIRDGKLNVAPVDPNGGTFRSTDMSVMYIYPQNNATFTMKLYDASGASYTHVENVTVGMGQTKVLNLPASIDFSKSGNFSTEDYGNGGSYEF